MPNEEQSAPRDVTVRAVPIELSQLLKFSGLSESGGAAKQAVSEGRVTVNGVVETQKAKKLKAGDVVSFEGKAVVVRVS